MRYAANRDSFLSPRASSSGSAHYQVSSNPTGPTKKDGTPDMRYAANRAAPSASWFSKHGLALTATASALHHQLRPLHRRSRRPKLHSLAQLSGGLRRQPDVLHHADFARHRK